jgi:hypothetical protein
MNRWVNIKVSVHPVLKQSFGTSLFLLNATVGWTIGQGIGSSGAEGADPSPLLLPNPKASDEPMPVPSVHPTVCFESFGHRTHPTHVEMRARFIRRCDFDFNSSNSSAFEFFVDSFASTLLPWTLWARWQPRNLSVHIFMTFGAWSSY